MNATASFSASVALVLDEIKHIKELHRSPHTKRLAFAIHIPVMTVVDSTGHLVDAVCPPDPTASFSALLRALRRKSAAFNDLLIWHHAPTMQSFVVHVPRLRAKITTLHHRITGKDAASRCVFVRLGERPSVSAGPPGALMEALDGMRDAMAASPDALMLSLSELFTEEALIPLAAVVLDYPVAYVPAFTAQTSFLEREPLDVYTVSFRRATVESNLCLGGEHVLLKFSCPQVLASHHAELSPSTVSSHLHAEFATVLEHIGASLVVTHRIETLDRVAL